MQEFDLSSEAFNQDPYPTYAAMRETPGAFWWEHLERAGTGGMWMFCRYRDVVEVLRASSGLTHDYKRLVPESDWTVTEHMMLNSDPPEHTRLRALLSRDFSAGGIRSLEPRIARLVDELLDRMLAQGGGEFISDFALPLPISVIAELLGVPLEDSPMLSDWSQAMIRGGDASQANAENLQRQAAATGNMTAYFNDLLKRPPGPGIVTELAGHVAQGNCSAMEALAQCVMIMVAGHETTVNLLGTGLFCLLRHPEEMRRLRDDPDGLMDPAINEMLRYESPLQRSTFRATTADFSIGGQQLEPGQRVSAVIAGANRDPSQFPEPDRFDISRRPNRHVAFGMGIHRCLGERLSRAEARIAFRRLLERVRDISLASDAVRFAPGNLFRRLESLPLRFS